jgi:hypothetical protein
VEESVRRVQAGEQGKPERERCNEEHRRFDRPAATIAVVPPRTSTSVAEELGHVPPPVRLERGLIDAAPLSSREHVLLSNLAPPRVRRSGTGPPRRRWRRKGDELEQLEQELLDEVAEIDTTWREHAEAVETASIRLEATDVRVAQLALVWVPTAS